MFRASDTVCRFGGDEFLILLPELECEGVAVAAADKVRMHLAQPYLIHQHPIEITMSIGLAIVASGESYRDVIQRADVEMYRDKARSAGCVNSAGAAVSTVDNANNVSNRAGR